MSLQTNPKEWLCNTVIPKSWGLIPVFEAEVNSIHSTKTYNRSDFLCIKAN